MIKSRWYKRKYAPWERIQPGERIYFKDAGEPITVQAEVEKVCYFEQLTPETVSTILDIYGKGIGIEAEHIPIFYERLKNYSYCMLIYLKSGQYIQPFSINKQGFGMMSSCLCVESVAALKR